MRSAWSSLRIVIALLLTGAAGATACATATDPGRRPTVPPAATATGEAVSSVAPDQTATEGEENMQEVIDQELARARHLLRPERAKVPLQEVAPLQPPERIGALAGLGFQAEDPDVMVSVYVFESWNQHPAAVEQLEAEVPMEGTRVLHGTNDRLLFFGYTRIDGPDRIDAKYRLSGLLSAFSGDE